MVCKIFKRRDDYGSSWRSLGQQIIAPIWQLDGTDGATLVLLEQSLEDVLVVVVLAILE